MAKAKRKGKKKGKVTIKQTTELRQKKDSTAVDTTGLKQVPTVVPSNIPVFRVKVRKK